MRTLVELGRKRRRRAGGRRWAPILLLAALAMLGFGRQSAAQRGGPVGTQLRILHAVTDVPAIDIRVDGQILFPEVLYKEVTQFRSGPDGSGPLRIEVLPAGLSGPVLARAEVQRAEGSQTSLAFNGANEDLGLLEIPVGQRPVEPTRDNPLGFLRLLHLSPDLAPLELIASDGRTLIDGTAYREVSPFMAQPSGQHDLSLRLVGASEPLIELPGQRVRTYFGSSIVVVGFRESDSLEVFVLEDPLGRGSARGTVTLPARTAPPGRGTPTATPRSGSGAPLTQMRFLHAGIDLGPVDVVLGGKVVAKDLAFGQASEYAALASGRQQLALVPAGQQAPILYQSLVGTAAGTYNTLALHGRADDLDLMTLTWSVQRAPLAGGQMRAVHLAQDLGPELDSLDAAAEQSDAIVLAEALRHDRAGPYVDLPVGSYEIRFHAPGETAALANLSAQRVDSSTWYSAFLIGSPAEANLAVLVLVDYARGTTPGLPGGSPRPGGEARMRVMNAAADAPVSSLFIGDVEAVSDLRYKQVSDYADFTAETYAARFVQAGRPSEVLAEGPLTILGDQHYSLLLIGGGADRELLLLSDDPTRPALGKARLRVAHVAYQGPAIDVDLKGGQQLCDDLAYRSASEYREPPAGFSSFELRDAASGARLLDIDEVWLKPGSVYTLFILGDGGAGLEALLSREVEHEDVLVPQSWLHLPRLDQP